MLTLTRYIVPAVAIVLSTAEFRAESVTSYREFGLGSSVQTVAALAKFDLAQVKTHHERPSLIQTIEWRAGYATPGSDAAKNPAKAIEFNFYDDQLYRIAVEYNPEQTRGMTPADIVEALSVVYGPVLSPTSRNPALGGVDAELDAGRIIGRWAHLENRIVAYQETNLYSSPDGSRFTVIVTSPRLASLSRSASAQAVRLDEREAPQREIDRRKKEVADEKLLQEQSRTTNKAAFTP
jgi:hypothetical protein